MFDRPVGGDASVLVSVDFGDPGYEESLQELRQLVVSAGMSIAGTVEARRPKPDPKFFVGSGKADELLAVVKTTDAKVAVFNHDLSPSQQRNLERLLEVRVVDRTGLILDIFALRAQSHEGKLQVELAQLEHLSTRLVRGWTHLERQKGGIGVRGGPGETQLELDRRMLRIRVKQLREKLAKLKQQRGMQRRARRRSQVLSVSLVGYTNAGKSTLFNRLTQSGVYAADQLFATLDTTSRKLYIPDGGPVVMSDTVGFIKHLPHALVEAFGATLEEAVQADLLLHIVDVASDSRDEQVEQVNLVLSEIGAQDVPQVLVLNQIDRVGIPPGLDRDEYGRISKVRVSAKTGEGLDLLRQALLEHQQGLQDQLTQSYQNA
ncbi:MULTISPECIES: GTPase HflX [Methylobacillus]|uniref:GTPase HflX n=1 Tax=Methylobacillus flagellatus (strain ATCC 51484 / DSM 6875 / VKM B-1610 / KT) TaxID=265072 RepID=Q1H0Y1_METFK|nr:MULTISPECIES: GTPase HflX [Methylobacillus]ABE49856.1 GTP-binding protein HflX [Methylobacillus flagellatus KT]MPS48918.1 GTPase HflX [Methylobacillus sp.]